PARAGDRRIGAATCALAGAAALAGVMLAAPCTARAADALQPVVIADTTTNVQLLLPQIALKQGFFAQHGIAATITMVKGDAVSVPALVSGSVNFGVMTATPALVADSKGAKLRIIAPLSTYPQQIVMRTALAKKLGITSASPLDAKVRALRGHTTAVMDIGGGLQYQLQAVLVSHGVNPKDVPVIGMAPYSAEMIALQRGAVDVIAPAVPFGQMAVAKGYGVMIANVWDGEVPQLRGAPFEVMAVNQTWAATHKTTVIAVRAALQDAMTYLHAHPAAAARLAHELQSNVPAEVQAAAVGTGAGFPTGTTISPAQFAAMQSFAKLSGAHAAAVTYQQAIWSP
ncbi:MAG: ABC transporter substrate-binding protein, partial [Acetobacteraceae bacterium]